MGIAKIIAKMQKIKAWNYQTATLPKTYFKAYVVKILIVNSKPIFSCQNIYIPIR